MYNKSLILTYNFAYIAATIDANLVKQNVTTAKSLTDQVNQFLASYADKPASAPWRSEDTLFSVWIGINDIGNSWYLAGDRAAWVLRFLLTVVCVVWLTRLRRSSFSDILINAYFALVDKLVSTGPRYSRT